MRWLIITIVLTCFCVPAIAQSTTPDQSLLTKTRSLYDAPFTRGLISFDCTLNFDWKQHFVDLLGSVPPAAVPTAERLQAIQHRVFVDRAGAIVSAVPKGPDLGNVAHATELEQVFIAITSSGLNAWLPSSTNVLLPVGPTNASWEKTDTGYKLTMNGRGVAGQLLLTADMRLTSGVTQLPQPMRFTTDFKPGPNGFLLASVQTGDTIDPGTSKVASFAYTYQTVQGFQLPFQVAVISATSETWHYVLADCKAAKGISITGLPLR